MLKKIEINDLLKYRYIENLSFNPSGTDYAYQLAAAAEDKKKYFRTIYVNHKKFAHRQSSFIISWFDDERLIISRTASNSKDVYKRLILLDVKTGKEKTLFKTPLSVSGLQKIDDNTLVFTADIDVSEPDLYLYDKNRLKKQQAKHKEETDYEVLDEIPYWLNGAGYINGKRKALFICTLKPFKIKRITDPYFAVSNFTHDDQYIYYSGTSYKRSMPLYEKIYAFDLKNNKTKCLYDKEDRMISDLRIFNKKLLVSSTDGKQYGINETSAFAYLENKELSEPVFVDRSLYDAAATDTLLGKGKQRVIKDETLYTLCTQKDHVELWSFDKNLKNHKLVSMPLIAFFDVGKDKIVFAAGNETSLPELYEYSFSTRKIKALTSFNKAALKDRYVALPQELIYHSADLTLNGFVLPPYDYDPKKKYPAILNIHGGPRAIYSTAFFHEMQVWASQGYFVLFTNIRGSDGRGDAFADIRGQYGAIDYQNLMDFTDAVLAKYKAIDPQRLCVTGGSYGGFMTNWIITHTKRFKAAASQRSIACWIGFTYLSDIGYYFAPDQNGIEDPIKDYQKLWDHSPLKYIDNAETPTLFIHSDEDFRCPLPEGMQMLQALCARNVETRLVVFHGENHELSRSGQPLHRIRRLKEITDWFNKHCSLK